jgi:hypothetical protein
MSQTKSQLIEGSAASELTAAKTLLGAGSAGAPSLTATGDTNTGIFFPTADTIAFAEGGVETVRIDSSGRVGIGTTSPSQKFDLSAGANLNLGIDQIAHNSFANEGIGLTLSASDSDTDLIALGVVDTNKLGIFSREGIVFGAGGATTYSATTERMRLDDSGRLLVGTSSARTTAAFAAGGSQLQVEGTTYQSSSLSLINNQANSDSSYFVFGKSRGTSTGSVTLVNDNDLLGTLWFTGADGASLIRSAVIEARVDGTPGANDMPGRLVFSTTADGASTPTERMRITQAGHVLIGCTSLPGGSTKGVGFYITGTDTEYLSSINTTASKNHIIFYNPNGTVGTIATNGSATAYNTSSDYRLKENVTPVSDGITRLQQLKPSRFNFIADPDTTVDGFIAHEAQAVVPECVTGTKDEVDNEGKPIYQGIDQSKLVPLLTAALQEAIGEIESLKARVAALEAQ